MKSCLVSRSGCFEDEDEHSQQTQESNGIARAVSTDNQANSRPQSILKHSQRTANEPSNNNYYYVDANPADDSHGTNRVSMSEDCGGSSQQNASSGPHPQQQFPVVAVAQQGRKAMASSMRQLEKVTLVVDQARFVVDHNVFNSFPDTMLGRMFGAPWEAALVEKMQADGEISIAEGISAAVFQAILDYYKSGVVTCPPNVSITELREAFDYLLIPFGASTVQCQDLCDLLHELTNDGARIQFQCFLIDGIMPLMVTCASRGDRECHIVIICDDDVVDWDQVYRPPMGDEYSGTIRNSQMYKFFKYAENRDVAKHLLRERGFKKIKLGIEGFPTHVEKIRMRAPGRAEVIYNYVQRPFLRMSWEKEEAKSRHVDFQCVRSKSGSILDAATDSIANVRLDPPPQVLVEQGQIAANINGAIEVGTSGEEVEDLAVQ